MPSKPSIPWLTKCCAIVRQPRLQFFGGWLNSTTPATTLTTRITALVSALDMGHLCFDSMRLYVPKDSGKKNRLFLETGPALNS
jgi:hypothetical protein